MKNLNFSRRDFLKTISCTATIFALPSCRNSTEKLLHAAPFDSSLPQPNILWISVEDISPDLGCYGDDYAVTPHLDRFAAQATRYNHAFTHAGVCAPARSGIITGLYPTTIGTHHMRCKGVPPESVKCFTEYLRAAGYYCSNNSKTDYQFDSPVTAWDQCDNKAHWRNRAPGQPFFSVINLTISHESRIRSKDKKLLERISQLSPEEKHDPDKAKIPPYYPDTPIVRQDWAQYYDIVTLMDKQAGDILKQLENDGLAEDTIVWFWGDHGRGLPRGKRWIYDSGIHVPLIIRVPKKLHSLAHPSHPDAMKRGTVNDELVSFIDFAPTMLSLAGIKIPDHLRGRAFLGKTKTSPREYVFAARDRMDEAYDIIRAVRDKKYKYLRNFMPYLTYGQDIDYMNQMPTMRQMRRLHKLGQLKGAQKLYFLPTKPVEELYDLETDPHEVNNLAGDRRYEKVLRRMRQALRQWMKETRDVGLIPEPIFDEMKRPGHQWQTTTAPGITTHADSNSSDTVNVTITCLTPGASIAYRTDGKTGKNGWKLYTQPVPLQPGQELLAKACRLGYRDSKVVRFKPGAAAIPAEKPDAKIKPHWRREIDHSNLLERLWAIKTLDRRQEKAIPAYFKALDDKYAAVRYWAVVGLHQFCEDAQAREKVKAALGSCLENDSLTVRIAAAEALCQWDTNKKALAVLVEALAQGTDSQRLLAAGTLGRIGEKARPALKQIKASLQDKSNYVVRTSTYTVARLEGK